jgi:type IV secretion system protein VirB10
MLIAEGSPLSSVLPEEEEAPPPPGGDPNTAFEAKVVRATTKSEQVEATSIADLYRTIAQGRVIQATMESALNTDLPAPIRAIVSRDTYGEAGHEPLIPKGSRLIGTYNTDLTGGQSRVFVVWTRVIRPDGVDVQLGSPLVDVIGQAGIGGQVDSKFQETFARSLLSSVLSIAMAIGSDKINRETGGSADTTTTTDAGSTQTTGSAASLATVDALNRLGSTSDDFIQRLIDPRPTILIDQGTPVNVFVNRDLIFPSRYGHSTKVVE